MSLSCTQNQYGQSFFWENDPILNFQDSSNVSATLTANHTFYVSSLLCPLIDSVTINVVDCSNSALFVPNAFSPNNDLVNDEFAIRGINIDAMELNIYDRYGKLVFQTNDPNKRWDGTFNGATLNSGVFIYTLKVTYISNETEEMHGNLTLVR